MISSDLWLVKRIGVVSSYSMLVLRVYIPTFSRALRISSTKTGSSSPSLGLRAYNSWYYRSRCKPSCKLLPYSKIYYMYRSSITSFFRCARLSRFSSCFLSAFTIFPSRLSAFIWRPREGVVSDWDTSSELSSNPVWPPSSSKSESESDLWSISSLKEQNEYKIVFRKF